MAGHLSRARASPKDQLLYLLPCRHRFMNGLTKASALTKIFPMYTESVAWGCGVHFSFPGPPCNGPPRCPYPVQRQPYVLQAPRNNVASRQRYIAAAAPEQAERFWSVKDVLQEVFFQSFFPSSYIAEGLPMKSPSACYTAG